MEFLFDIFVSIGLNQSLSKILSFFLFEIVYLSVLLMIGLIFFTFIRVRFLGDDFAKKLENKPKILVYLGMALLGIISPFCSCSTIPVFVSFSALGVPTGALFVYLITSPLVQEASLILLITEFGLPVAITYIVLGVISGLVAGTLISKVKDSELFNASVLKERNSNTKYGNETYTTSCCGDEEKAVSCCDSKEASTSCCGDEEMVVSCCDSKEASTSYCGDEETVVSCCDSKEVSTSCCSGNESIKTRQARVYDKKKEPFKYAVIEARKTFLKTFKYIVIGIAFGSLIYGVIPEEMIASTLGASSELAPILATGIGIPVYADDVALIPIAKTLVESGAGLGTALSFVMASAVVSIPSFIMLSAALKKKTIIKLVVFLSLAIIIIGYVFNFLQPYLVG